MPIMMFSVAVKGSSCRTRRLVTLGYPTNPSEVFCNVFNTVSAVRRASLIAQLVKNLPVMQETLVGFLGREELLEKG